MENVLFRVVTSGFILREDKKFLLIQRAKHDSWPGIWEMPGGLLEIGEDPAAGVIREVREETGLRVQTSRPLAVQSTSSKNSNGGGMKQTTRIAFLCHLQPELRELVLSQEHEAYQWITIEDLPVEMLSEFTAFTIEQAQKQHVL